MYQEWIKTYDEIINKHKKDKEITIDKKIVDNIVVELQVQAKLAEIWREERHEEIRKRIELEDELIMIKDNIERILINNGALGRIPKKIIDMYNNTKEEN
jgi:hypothetical protein